MSEIYAKQILEQRCFLKEALMLRDIIISNLVIFYEVFIWFC